MAKDLRSNREYSGSEGIESEQRKNSPSDVLPAEAVAMRKYAELGKRLELKLEAFENLQQQKKVDKLKLEDLAKKVDQLVDVSQLRERRINRAMRREGANYQTNIAQMMIDLMEFTNDQWELGKGMIECRILKKMRDDIYDEIEEVNRQKEELAAEFGELGSEAELVEAGLVLDPQKLISVFARELQNSHSSKYDD